MKKIIILSFIALILIIKASAQNPIPEKNVFDQPTGAAHIIKVLSALLSSDSVTQSRNQPSAYYYWKATIKSIGTGIVNYKWIMSYTGAQVTKTGSITLSGTGTDYIYIETCFPCTGPKSPFPNNPTMRYYIDFQIESPNRVYSNHIGLL